MDNLTNKKYDANINKIIALNTKEKVMQFVSEVTKLNEIGALINSNTYRVVFLNSELQEVSDGVEVSLIKKGKKNGVRLTIVLPSAETIDKRIESITIKLTIFDENLLKGKKTIIFSFQEICK